MKPLLAALLALLCVASAGQVRGGQLTVVFRATGDRPHLAAVFAAWRSAERDLRALGLRVPKARLEAAGDSADFARRTGEPWFVAASTRGATIRTQRLGALAARGLLPFTVRHEAFHAAQPRSLPRWLAEGLARVFSGEAAGEAGLPTRLEKLTGTELGAQLVARQEGSLNGAYREASRRARQLLQRGGWAQTLATR